MYLEYFGLDDFPFDGLPDRRFYYVGGAQHQSLGLLTTALSRSGSICVLSGSSGAGKTTLVRMLMRSLPRRMRIISIDDPRLDPHMLLATILRACGVVATSFESIAELTLKLRQMLEKSISIGVITTVICDEAQGLSDDVLEQIRLISNIEGEAGKMINFLLVGQEDLITHLNKPEHDMLKNRIKIFAMLPKLKEDEVGAYLTYRLQQANCVKPIFTNKAISVITKKSQGVPRLINAIADMCLTLAAQKKKDQVNSFIASKAANIVQHHKVGIADYVASFVKELISISLYERIAVIAGAAVCAFGAFFGALYLMQSHYQLKSIEESLITDNDVQQRYQKVSNYLLQGKNAQGRQLYYFNKAVSQAYFKSEAFATLFKLHGYSLSDPNTNISNEILKDVGLQSLHQVGSFAEAISYNSPVLVSLLDDNLTPFYVVLYQIDDDIAQIIVGDYLFAVKLSYLEDHYMGGYTLLHPYVGDIADLKSPKTDTRKAMENVLRPYLVKYQQRALESANREAYVALSNLDRQKEAVYKMRFEIQKRVLDSISTSHKSDEEVEAELDKALNAALAKSKPYQDALKTQNELEQISTEKEVRADNIRTISLKLDDGFPRAMELFLQEQNLNSVNNQAVALLTLTFSDGPRLINVVKNTSASLKLKLPEEKDSKSAKNEKKADDNLMSSAIKATKDASAATKADVTTAAASAVTAAKAAASAAASLDAGEKLMVGDFVVAMR